MKHALAGLFVMALGCSGGAEIPPVEIGGESGARLMNGQAKTPFDAYDMAYSQITKQHQNVRRCVDPRTKNLFGAQEALREIIRSLQTMRSLVIESDQPKFDPYLVRYKAWLGAVEKDTWGGSFLSDLEASEREIKSRFYPGTTAIVSEFPASMAKEIPPAPPPAPPQARHDAPADIPEDRVHAPPKRSLPSSEPPSARPTLATPPASAPEDSSVSFGLFYSAWDRTHDGLVEYYKAKKDCRARFERLMEALRHMKNLLPRDRAAKLQIYIDYYGAVSEKTKSFTTLPEKTAERDIIDELEVAARVIRKEFNPDP
jgi:hypothetical protein